LLAVVVFHLLGALVALTTKWFENGVVALFAVVGLGFFLVELVTLLLVRCATRATPHAPKARRSAHLLAIAASAARV